MKRFLTLWTISAIFVTELSLEYTCKIHDKNRNNAHTFLNSRNVGRKGVLTSKDKHKLAFVSSGNHFKSHKRPRQDVKYLLKRLNQEGEGCEFNSGNDEGCDDLSILTDPEGLDKSGETVVFSDFSDLYKDLTPIHREEAVTGQPEGEFKPVENKCGDKQGEGDLSFDERSYTLSKRLFVKRLFKNVPQFVDTKAFLVRSKAFVKGKVGSKCDLSIFDSNKEKTGKVEEKPFENVKSILPGVFTGLHTVKHTKKRIIRELKVKVDLYVKALTSQLKSVTEFYGQLGRYIHPFQYHVFKTCLHEMHSSGETKVTFEKLLGELASAKKQIILRGNEVNKQITGIRRCREAFKFVNERVAELDALYSSFQGLYDQYRQYCGALRRLPVVDIERPAVAVIGHVNAGKTTLFNQISQGPLMEEEPRKNSHIDVIADTLGIKWLDLEDRFRRSKRPGKVGSERFTTRGLNVTTLGYTKNCFIHEAQLLDTPGLLWRRGRTDFNPFEKLTYSVLKDLPSGVVFCFDLSGRSSLEDQVELHASLRSRFPLRPWTNVVVQGNEFGEKLQTLKERGIETCGPEECYGRIQSMFTTLHDILGL